MQVDEIDEWRYSAEGDEAAYVIHLFSCTNDPSGNFYDTPPIAPHWEAQVWTVEVLRVDRSTYREAVVIARTEARKHEYPTLFCVSIEHEKDGVYALTRLFGTDLTIESDSLENVARAEMFAEFFSRPQIPA